MRSDWVDTQQFLTYIDKYTVRGRNGRGPGGGLGERTHINGIPIDPRSNEWETIRDCRNGKRKKLGLEKAEVILDTYNLPPHVAADMLI